MSEKFLAEIINYLAKTRREELILKGGMLLRLTGSPRRTNDLDYAWQKVGSRKPFAKSLQKDLENLDGVKVLPIELNSRGIFINIIHEPTGQTASIEINVVNTINQPVEQMTTERLADKYNLEIEVVTTMAASEAFANKIAASIERDVVRDLYDLSQFQPLGPFDEKTLRERLDNLCINQAKPKKVSFKEAAKLLQDKLDALTSQRINLELKEMMDEKRLIGLDRIIRASVGKIIQDLGIGINDDVIENKE